MIRRRAPLKRSVINRRKPRRRAGVVDVPYREWVRERGCVITSHGTTPEARDHCCDTQPTIHHVRRCGDAKDDWRVLPICASGHLHGFGDYAIERGKDQWERHWGIDIEKAVAWYQERFQEFGW